MIWSLDQKISTCQRHIPCDPGFLYRMYFNLFFLSCLLLGDSSFSILPMFFLVCRKFSLKWQGTCLARPVCVENDIWQPSNMHLKGFTPTWDSKCLVSQLNEQLGRLNTLQCCQRQTKMSQDFMGSTWVSCAWLASWLTSVAMKLQSIHLHSRPSFFFSLSSSLNINGFGSSCPCSLMHVQIKVF